MWTVRLPLLCEGYLPPSRTPLALSWPECERELGEYDRAQLGSWPLGPLSSRDVEGADALARVASLLAARTPELWHLELDEGLVQCVCTDDSGNVFAHYLFDERYALAHPESVDDEHLVLLHGTIAAKLFDGGALVVDEAGLRASLHWRSARTRARRLTRSGGR